MSSCDIKLIKHLLAGVHLVSTWCPAGVHLSESEACDPPRSFPGFGHPEAPWAVKTVLLLKGLYSDCTQKPKKLGRQISTQLDSCTSLKVSVQMTVRGACSRVCLPQGSVYGFAMILLHGVLDQRPAWCSWSLTMVAKLRKVRPWFHVNPFQSPHQTEIRSKSRSLLTSHSKGWDYVKHVVFVYIYIYR